MAFVDPFSVLGPCSIVVLWFVAFVGHFFIIWVGVRGFFVGSGSSLLIGVTASFGIIPSSISSFRMLVGPEDVVLIRGVTILSSAFLSSQATNSMSTVFLLSGPPT